MKTDSLQISLLVAAVSLLYFIYDDIWIVSQLAEAARNLAPSSSDPFARFFNGLLLSTIASDAKAFDHRSIDLNTDEEVVSVWLDCNRFFARSLSVTSYVVGWFDGENLATRTLHEQGRKARVGTPVFRVFIYERSDEAVHTIPIKFLQESPLPSHLLDIRLISVEQLVNNKVVEVYRRTLNTWDFALIDDSCVFLHYLDGNRRTSHARLTYSAEHVEAARKFIDWLKANAQPLSAPQVQSTSVGG